MRKTNVCCECGSSFCPDDNENICAYCYNERKLRLKKFTNIITTKEVTKQNGNITKRHSNELHPKKSKKHN